MNSPTIRLPYILLVLCTTVSAQLGGWSISQELFDWICRTVPERSTIVEFGSGFGSYKLAQHYVLYSIEHSHRWLNKYQGPLYIHAPIVKGTRWYDVDILKKSLPESYSLLLVDGPPGTIGRMGFFHNLSVFKTDGVIIVFDDIHRSAEYTLMMHVAAALHREPYILETDPSVGILLP